MSGYAEVNPQYQPALRLITMILRNNALELIGTTDGAGAYSGNVFTAIGVAGLRIFSNQYVVVGGVTLTVVSSDPGAQPLSSSDPLVSATLDKDTGDIVITGARLNTPVFYNLTSPTIVQTSFNHNYVDDLIIKLFVPSGYGMTQVNQQFSRIVVLSDTSFSMELDTHAYDAFIYPSEPVRQRLPRAAQCTPTGSFNNTTLGATRNVLPFTGITS